MSKQMTFTLACAVVLSAVIPGAAGYLSARAEAIEMAELSLRSLETRLRAEAVADALPVSLPPDPCMIAPPPKRRQQPPAAAFVPAPEQPAEPARKPRRERAAPPVVPPPEWFPSSVTPADASAGD